MGFYTPYAVDQNLTPYSNAAKIRQSGSSSTASISKSATPCRNSRTVAESGLEALIRLKRGK